MTGSRPARAMRGAAILATLAIAWRMPVMRREFAAALMAAEGPRATDRRAVAPPSKPPVAAFGRVAGPSTGPQVAVAQVDRAPGTTHDPHNRGNASRTEPWKRASRRRGADGERIRKDFKALASVGGPPPRPAPVVGSSPAPALAASTSNRAGSPAPLASAAPTTPAAFDLATAAYARLAAGDRRGAVLLFDAALALGGPRGGAWRAQRDALTRQWSASAYSIIRAGGGAGAAVTPVLGGGQSGGGIAFTPDPLALRPIAMTLRGSLAHDDSGRTAFAAVGVQWRPRPGVTVAAERLIGVGPAARDEWTARVAAGDDSRIGRLRAAIYAEAGIIGSAGYAAGQARIGPEFHDHGVAIVSGVGAWASVQRDSGRTVDRLDLGPGVAARAGPLAVAVDYRFRVAGNAAPGSGPVVTLSATF